jgi:hypothetical protein
MKKITVELSEAEYYAMQIIAYTPEEWADNAIKNRARIAIEEIVAEIVAEKLNNGETISGTKEEILMSSGLKTSKETTDELDSQLDTDIP